MRASVTPVALEKNDGGTGVPLQTLVGRYVANAHEHPIARQQATLIVDVAEMVVGDLSALCRGG